jgi:hypothetical protein
MNGPEPLFRLKVVRQVVKANPDYTGYGCGLPPGLPTGETRTTYFGPYVRRHAASSMKGSVGSGAYVVSAEIETCHPVWDVVAL